MGKEKERQGLTAPEAAVTLAAIGLNEVLASAHWITVKNIMLKVKVSSKGLTEVFMVEGDDGVILGVCQVGAGRAVIRKVKMRDGSAALRAAL